MKGKDLYFGRNMDIDYNLGEKIVICPRNYHLNFYNSKILKNHYGIMGMATVVNDYPLFADAVNEKGLCIAGLNFPGNAYYTNIEHTGKDNIAVHELIPWILGKCSTIIEVKKILSNINITSRPFNGSILPASLHWHIADKDNSIVLEIMKDGMHIYDNPVKVLTNNPPFEFHLTNLKQYTNLNVETQVNDWANFTNMKPFGKGFGSIGLPGDFSPASRFVKAAYILHNSEMSDDEEKSVSQFFHILDSVAVVDGIIEKSAGNNYCTVYSSCINATRGIYYCKNYYNNQITAVKIFNEDLNSSGLTKFSIQKSQQINYIN